MKDAQWRGLTIRAALVLGFGLTLGLWVFAGWRFTGRIAQVQLEAEAVNERYVRAQTVLGDARSQVLLVSLSVRDALLDPDREAVSRARPAAVATFDRIDAELASYVPVLDMSEQARIDQLRQAMAALRARLLDVIADSNRSALDTYEVLRSRVVPQRQAVIDISDEVQELNRAAFVSQQVDLARIYRTTQRQMLIQLGLSLAASLAIALFATLYAGRLEARLRRQREREEQHADDLQKLSAKLIAAQEEERRGIARELHDELGQVLSAIKVEIALARRALSGAPESDALVDAETMADTALATVRDLSRLLHPSVLDDLGLPAAVDSYLRGFGARYNLRVELLADRMDERLQPEVEVTAYRIIQEALTNVSRHARAQSCRVYLQRLAATILITIEDDGIGFDPDAVTRPDLRTGLGLLGIRERASLLRGTLRLESARGGGTRITVELPAATPAPPAEDPETIVAGSLPAGEAVHG